MTTPVEQMRARERARRFRAWCCKGHPLVEFQGADGAAALAEHMKTVHKTWSEAEFRRQKRAMSLEEYQAARLRHGAEFVREWKPPVVKPWKPPGPSAPEVWARRLAQYVAEGLVEWTETSEGRTT